MTWYVQKMNNITTSGTLLKHLLSNKQDPQEYLEIWEDMAEKESIQIILKNIKKPNRNWI